MDKRALLMIDVQMNMFGEPTVARADAVLHLLGELLDKARAATVPVIHVQHCGAPDEVDAPGAPGWQLHPAVAPHAGEIIVQKGDADAFAGTPLDTILRAFGIDEVVVAGMQSELCIHDTCRRAHALGYTVTLVEDAHSTYPDGTMSAATLVSTVNRAIGDVMRVRPVAALTWA